MQIRNQSDAVICRATKTIKQWQKIISRNISQNSVLQPWYQKCVLQKKLHLLCCCHDKTLGCSLFLSETKDPHLQPFDVGLMVLLGTDMVPIIIVTTVLVRLLGLDDPWLRQKLGISFLIKTAPAAKLLSWQQHSGCHFVSWVMYISGAKFSVFRTSWRPLEFHHILDYVMLVTLVTAISLLQSSSALHLIDKSLRWQSLFTLIFLYNKTLW